MKKFDFSGGGTFLIPLKRTICLVLLLCCTVLTAQAQMRISINVKNASIKEVLDVLRRHDYRLVYQTTDINSVSQRVSITMSGATASQVLSAVFKGTALSYNVEGNLITIRLNDTPDRFTVSGTVRDHNGLPLIAATIIVKETNSGTITNDKGEFTIRVSKGNTLQFFYIGMVQREIPIQSAQSSLNVMMREDPKSMEDVVVTGYQVLNKRESTSAIVTLKATELVEPVGISIDNMLQGKVAGMSVMQQTSTIGAAPKIRIRGTSTLIGNREPVWVLDGVVLTDPVKLDATELNSMDKVNLIGNAISGLNPEDIDRIDVLKDASATALYGTKAANGVIVITTKRGKTGSPSVRYSTSMSFVAAPTYEKAFLMNSNDRIGVSEEMHMRGLEFKGFTPKGVGYEGALQQLWNNELSTPQFYARVKQLREMNTDWFKLLFRNSFSHSHTVSVSGANDKVNYYFSVGYADQQGAKIHEDGNRFNFMSNLGFQITKNFRIGVQLAANVSTTNRPTVDLFQYAYTTSRAIPAFNDDGSLAFYDASATKFSKIGPNNTAENIPLAYNVFNELENSGNTQKSRNINTNINMSYRITSWLSADALMSYNTSTTHQETHHGERSYAVAQRRGLPYGFDLNLLSPNDQKTYKDKICEIPFGGILKSQEDATDTYFIRGSLNANKIFNQKHSISFGAGFEVMSTNSTGYQRTDYGYLPERGKKFITLDNLTDWPKAAMTYLGQTPILVDGRNNNVSYYALASYGYDQRYIFSANVRGEASNKFGSDKSARFIPIWSVSGRWNLTEEHWMQGARSILTNFGVRSSYGIQANVTDAHNPNMVVSLGSLDTKTQEYIARLISLPNQGLRWEKTYAFDLGIDFSLFNGRLGGSFDYYHKKSRDQLYTVEVETTNGGRYVTINGGDLTNKGWDLNIFATLIRKRDFSWTFSFNTGKAKNSVANLAFQQIGYENYLNGSLLRNGYAVNSFYSYRFGGLDENGYPTYLGVKEKDENGNLLFKNLDEALASALVYSGKREADINGGFSTFFKYKNFGLNVMFSFSLGSKVRLNDLYTDGDNFRLPYPHQNMSSDFNDRWRNPGDKTDIPALSDETRFLQSSDIAPTYGGQMSKNFWQMYNDSDLRVVSGNYLRCRSISLSYSFPTEMLRKIHIKGLSLSLSMTNPFVIKAKGLKGRDPEQVTLGSNSIPPQKNYAFSMNLNF